MIECGRVETEGEQRARQTQGRCFLATEKEQAGRTPNDRALRIAGQYAERYRWADHEALKLFFRIDLVGDALHAAGTRVHASVLPAGKRWLARVLRALYMAPDHRLSHAEIGKETGVPPANVTYQVDALRDEGYVRRVPHESDRRITLVELTPKGESLCDTIIPAWTRFITELGNSFTAKEKRDLNELLERLQMAAESNIPEE